MILYYRQIGSKEVIRLGEAAPFNSNILRKFSA